MSMRLETFQDAAAATAVLSYALFVRSLSKAPRTEKQKKEDKKTLKSYNLIFRPRERKIVFDSAKSDLPVPLEPALQPSRR
jgi:hypothetical protein